MKLKICRSGKEIRTSNAMSFLSQRRDLLEEAWPGDIIGLVGHDGFGIGDTLTTDASIRYDEIPRFTPEVFEYFHNPNTAKFKQFRQGLDQLLLEGVAQAFHLKDTASRVPLLAAVGPLQFEVVQWRLQSEYNAESRLTPTPWTVLRWLKLPDDATAKNFDYSRLIIATGVSFGSDKFENPIALFPNDWTMRYFVEKNAEIKLLELPPEQS
jgi:peptide chain release factor 3